jgi:hypothetical protein
LLLVESKPYGGSQRAVNDDGADKRDGDSQKGACDLSSEAHPSSATKRRLAKDASGDTTPGAAKTM